MTETSPKRVGLFGRLFGRSDTPAEIEKPAESALPPLVEDAADLSRPPAVEPAATPVAEPETAPAAAISDGVPAVGPDIEPEPKSETAAVPAIPAPVVEPEPAAKQGWFSRLKSGLTKTSSKLTEGITGLFTKKKLDADTLDNLEDLLIQADLGVDTAMRITETLSKSRYEKGISAEDVRSVLASEVSRVLRPVARPLAVRPELKPHVILVVGVNGTGKTTTIGKLAAQFRRQGHKVMMAAGDTFRAAAVEQLKIWGERTGTPVVARPVGADASGLAFDALKDAKTSGCDVLLIDTAGRLQNKQALMDELEKVVRVLRKLDATAPHDVLLVLDATTGQNALGQVEVFRERAGVSGLIMTKLDGTAGGGFVVAIAAKFGLPVHAIGVGEGVDDLQAFDADEFARAIALS